MHHKQKEECTDGPRWANSCTRFPLHPSLPLFSCEILLSHFEYILLFQSTHYDVSDTSMLVHGLDWNNDDFQGTIEIKWESFPSLEPQ